MINNNQNSYSGLKVGAGMAVLGTGAMFGMNKVTNAITAKVAKDSRKIISEQDKFLKNADKYVNLTSSDAEKLEQLKNEAVKLKENAYNTANKMFERRKAFKNNFTKSHIAKSLAIAIPFYLGAGAIVDYMNNRKRANSEPNAKTKKGNDYVKTNMGKKLGLGLGLLSQAGMYGLNVLAKNNIKGSAKVSTFVSASIGGFVLGAIADKMTNKAARKQADKAV